MPFLGKGRGGVAGRQKGKAAHHHWRHQHQHHEEEAREEESGVVVEGEMGGGDRRQWAGLPMELLVEVIQRVEAREKSWPGRRQVVACAAVCRSWREATLEVVRNVEHSGRITFPVSLRQPGPRDLPLQCFVRRERATSTYFLYLGLSPALLVDTGKLLFVARKIRRARCTDFIISLASDEFSRASSMYIGKLRSNFLGTKFTIYDSQPPADVSSITPSSRSSLKIHSKQVSPLVLAGKYNIGTISYELSVLRSRGPRRMLCTMHSIPLSVIYKGGEAPTPSNLQNSLEGTLAPSLAPTPGNPMSSFCSRDLPESSGSFHKMTEPLVLKNKAPQWHEQLQCWCLNFRGRVTVASVKNFQLVAAAQPSYPVSVAEEEKVILQFGKIGKDIFTMDYHYPLTAFQAFAICLSSLDTKPACE